MKKIFTTLFLSLSMIFAGQLHSQSFQWVKHQTHNIPFNPDFARFACETDIYGNAVTATFQNYKQAFGQSFYGDVSVRKYNSSGTLLVNKILTGKIFIEEIESDAQGNIYLSGSFMDTLRVDSVNFFLNTVGGFNLNHFILKLSGSGNFIWWKNVNVIYSAQYSVEAINVRGNFLFAGVMNIFNGSIKKFDFNGNELMSIQHSNVRGISGIDIDGNGNIFAGGACGSGSITLGNLVTSTSFTYNNYFVKYNSSGSCQWAKFVEDATFQSVDIMCDNEGNLLAAGDLMGDFTFGSITTQGPQWVYDFFLTKLDPAGNFLWVNEVPNSGPITGDASKADFNSIAVDKQNNIYFSGFFRGTVSWGNNVSTSSAGSLDLLLLKFNPSGIVQSGKTAGGSSNERADDISIDAAGNIYLSGNLSSTAFFDTITVTGNGNINSFISKIKNSDNSGIMNVSAIIEGFYDETNNNMRMSDSVTLYLRNSSSPFAKIDSSVSTIDAVNLMGTFEFASTASGNYYLQIMHRNSIETWSANGVSYTTGEINNYDFTISSSQAFGNNMKQIDNSPLRFGIYSGDPNRDGFVDLSDLVLIFNDASIFATGYIPTDINGDNFADLSDLVITLNNSSNFVSVIRP